MVNVMVLAIALSLDALSVGMVYAVKGIKIPLLSKINICVFSMVYSMIALIMGKKITGLFQPIIAKYIGITLLLLMGAWFIVQALLKEKPPMVKNNIIQEKTLIKLAIRSLGITIMVVRDPLAFDLDHSGSISSFEALMLGLALSIDAIGVSIGSALIGSQSFFIPMSIGIFQLIFIYLGTFLAKKMVHLWEIDRQILSLLPGIFLIFIALSRL